MALMTAPLTLRDLNRATLARQMLLGRERIRLVTAIERLVGLHLKMRVVGQQYQDGTSPGDVLTQVPEDVVWTGIQSRISRLPTSEGQS